jgi:uncharacterized protein YegP (UPF0339 family)
MRPRRDFAFVDTKEPEAAADVDAARVELWRDRSGSWRWRFAQDHQVLRSAEDYQDRGQAEHAAGIAYPGLPIVERELPPEPGSPTFWLLLVGGAVVLVLVLLAVLGLIGLVLLAIGWRQVRRRMRRAFGPA